MAERARWRVGLVDSCGGAPQALAGRQFRLEGGAVRHATPGPDPSGHGSRIAAILTGGRSAVDLVLAQVFAARGATSAAVVAAAIDWCVAQEVDLVQLSLGLAADRPVLATAVARALEHGCLVVAATPARGTPTYPAEYPGVIRGTGDARCAAGEVSRLGPVTFGGCVSSALLDAAPGGQGASIGAAWVTRALLAEPAPLPLAGAIAALSARSRYDGPERRSHPAADRRS